MTKALVPKQGGDLATADILADFAKFLRLHTADGDASPETLRSYHSNASQFVAWCAEHGISPATATEDNIAAYRKALVAQYEVGTVAVKLAAIRRLYEAAVWRGLRQDNPAAGLKAPRDKTERSERVKFLPLDGLRRLLDAPRGNDPAAVRDRAMLAMMGRHGLRVSEVAGLTVDAVDFAGTVKVFGKGRKARTVYLCYAREDERKVEELYQKLSDEGFEPWMDKKDILPGEMWENSIQKAIRRSDFFLVCLSTNSVSKFTTGHFSKGLTHGML